MYEVMIKTEFASAHNLKFYKGACEALHGHNWKVEITVETDKLDQAGIAVDFNVLKAETNAIVNGLDHIYLNDHEAFKEQNPSSENIARYIFEEVALRLGDKAKVKKVTIWETDNAAASYMETVSV